MPNYDLFKICKFYPVNQKVQQVTSDLSTTESVHGPKHNDWPKHPTSSGPNRKRRYFQNQHKMIKEIVDLKHSALVLDHSDQNEDTEANKFTTEELTEILEYLATC